MTNVPSEAPRWDLTDLYQGPSDPHIQADLQAATDAVEQFVSVWGARCDYLSDPRTMQHVLTQLETLELRHGCEVLPGDHGYGKRPMFYLTLAAQANLADQELETARAQAAGRYKELEEKMSFFWTKVRRIGPKTQQKMLAAPELEPYRARLSREFELGLYGPKDPGTALKLRASATRLNLALNGEMRPLTVNGRESYYPLPALKSFLMSPDLEISRAAGGEMAEVLRAATPVALEELETTLNLRLDEAPKRGFANPFIATCIEDDTKPHQVKTMLDTVHAYSWAAQRFYELKGRLKGERLDFFTRFTSIGAARSPYSWAEAVTMVRDLYETLDPWLALQLGRALTTSSIDAEARPGKRGGAFCGAAQGIRPRLLMSFTGDLTDAVRLSHEMGHYTSFELMQTLNPFDCQVSRPLQETVGLFMEQAFLNKAMRGVSDEARLDLLMRLLENDVGSVFNQVAMLRLEQALYKEVAQHNQLRLERVDELCETHLRSYLGDEMDFPSGASRWWVQSTHLLQQFYTYAYAYATMVAKAMYARYEDDPGFMKEVVRFMGTGRGQAPDELLGSMGLDTGTRELWESGIHQWLGMLNEAQYLAHKLGKT